MPEETDELKIALSKPPESSAVINDAMKEIDNPDYHDSIDSFIASNFPLSRQILTNSSYQVFTKAVADFNGNLTTNSQALSEEQAKLFLSNPQDDQSKARKRKALLTAFKIFYVQSTTAPNEAANYGEIVRDLVFILSKESGARKEFAEPNPGAAPVATGKLVLPKQRLQNALNKVSPPPDPPDASAFLPESITPGFIKQCILLSRLETLKNHYYAELRTAKGGKTLGELAFQGEHLYGGSIVPINIANPELLIGMLTGPQTINNGLFGYGGPTKSELLETLINSYEICFVKKARDSNDNFKTHEFKFVSPEGSVSPIMSNVIDYLVTSNQFSDVNEARRHYINANRLIQNDLISEYYSYLKATGASTGQVGNNFNCTGLDVSIEGSNPSTARSDVKVTLTFDLTEISALKEAKNCVSKQDQTVTEKFSLSDLVNFPYYEEQSTGYGRTFKSQYDPNHNRIRLYLYTSLPEVQADGTPFKPAIKKFNNNENSLALDLALVDHDISKSGEGLNTVVTFKVTYRGYAESFLATPLMDSLIDKGTLERRIEREKILKTAVQEGCKLSKVQQIVTDLNNAAAAESNASHSRIIQQLLDRQRLYQATISKRDSNNIISNIYRTQTEKEKEDSKKVRAQTAQAVGNNARFTGANTATTMPNDQPTFDSDTTNDVHFFYLFDLIDVINDNLYNKTIPTSIIRQSDEMSDFVGDTNYKFFLGPISVPMGGSRQMMNLGLLPISVDFFIEWYKENVTEKDLTFFPIVMFIRQLTERLVTNMLSELCFSDQLDNKVLIRTSFFEDCSYLDYEGNESFSNSNAEDCYRQLIYDFFDKEKFFSLYNDSIFNINPNSKSNAAVTADPIVGFTPLFRTSPITGIRTKNKKPTACIVIYGQGRSDVYSQELISQLNTFNRIPKVDVTNTELSWFLRNWSFSKVQQQGLREARYFNTSLNSITQLTAVYDITLDSNKLIASIFPGQVFKIDLQTIGDPADTRSLAYQLGLGGYHLVTKVQHSLKGGSLYDPRLSTTITMRWFASGAPQDVVREVIRNPKIADPSQMILDEGCDALTNYSAEISSTDIAILSSPGIIAPTIKADETFEERTNELANQYGISQFGNASEFTTAINGFRTSAQLQQAELNRTQTNTINGVKYEFKVDNDGVMTITNTSNNDSIKLDKENMPIEE
jgi:hypothetical protein